MSKENGLNKHVWTILTILSIIFIVWTLFFFNSDDQILPTVFKLAGSPHEIEGIEKNALGFISFFPKIFIIFVVAVLSLLIGGWIATRMIKMDGRNNLIDW